MLLLSLSVTVSAELRINEILFNPPGTTDFPNEYIELRGTPNLVLPPGTYLVAVEGDANGNPGTVQNVFNLAGRAIGGNGFLVLLQKTNSYTPNSGATALVNRDSGIGWGSGSTSSVGHRGEGGQTDLENPSVTFFLIQTTNSPAPGADIDSDNDGAPDGPVFASWTILDSVGVLDGDGPGDVAYGAINFRRSTAPGNGAVAAGTIVPVTFTPSYVGRAGNSTGSAAADWVAGDNLAGAAPNWILGSVANTHPAALAGAPLNHLGGPNFGADALPGVVISQTAGSTDVTEGGGTDSYTIALNTSPIGPVVIQVESSGQTEISTDAGLTFSHARTLTFNIASSRTVTVRALADHLVDTSPHLSAITHTLTSTADRNQYPLATLAPSVVVNITESDSVLLSELKVNPPGTDDEPNEFVEIRGGPNTLLTNVYFLVIEGDAGVNPGKADLVLDLTSRRLGSSGLLLIAARGHPYVVPDGTTILTDTNLNALGGALGNGAVSFLLVSSPAQIVSGEDLDNGDNGILEGLPKGTTILDAVGWTGGGTNDIVYGGAVLSQRSGVPDAATRFSFDSTPRSAAAWFCGDLAGSAGDTLIYDKKNVSANFPAGTPLTPGIFNNSAPSLSPLTAISGVIGDPNNPTITFTVSDAETDPGNLLVTAVSSNPLVVPNENLTISAGLGGRRALAIQPIGVGYSRITLTVADDDLEVRAGFSYAASAQERPGGRFHAGTSDGSTAIPIDANLMFVGDDENQVLRLYRRHESGLPLSQFDMTPFLDLVDIENGTAREVDIEASTRVGSRLFWMGAHSHANIGEMRLNRGRIFATDIVGAGGETALTYAGRYDYLKEDLVSWDRNNLHGKGADYFGLAASAADGVEPKLPDGSGFNLEGLAMAPGSVTAAYVACRAPIVAATNRNYALIIPVLNFTTLAISGAGPGSAVFGDPIEMDLYGRGIRSLEGSAGGYMLIGGPAGDLPGDYPQDFRLYTWTGHPLEAPQQRAADLAGLNPEGVIELPPSPWTAESTVDIVSDNGKKVYYDDGIIAKHLTEPNFKKFRSDTVRLGEIVKPAPWILSTRISEGGVILTWRALKGERYRVQCTSDFAAEAWSDLPGEVLADGPIATKVDGVDPRAQRFYRIVLAP